MTTKQELRDRLAARTTEVLDLRREVNALNRELTELRADLAQAKATAPESEPEGRVYAIRSDTPPGLVVTEDGSLLNWEGENYVRQQPTPEPIALTLSDGTRIEFDAVVTR